MKLTKQLAIFGVGRHWNEFYDPVQFSRMVSMLGRKWGIWDDVRWFELDWSWKKKLCRVFSVFLIRERYFDTVSHQMSSLKESFVQVYGQSLSILNKFLNSEKTDVSIVDELSFLLKKKQKYTLKIFKSTSSLADIVSCTI